MKRTLLITLALTLLLLTLCCTAALADTTITSGTTRWSGNMVATGSVTIDNHDSSTNTNRVYVENDTVLTLSSGSVLTVPWGIYVPEGVTLTIKGSGKLYAGTEHGADTEICEMYCAGIGGGWYNSNTSSSTGPNCGTVIFDLNSDGEVVARAGNFTNSIWTESYPAGIGGAIACTNGVKFRGGSGGNIIIRGGKITAYGYSGGAGIGGSGYGGNAGNITITGGTVTACGYDGGAGIGGGEGGNGGNITISGGTVTASSFEDTCRYFGGPGIGNGGNGEGGSVTINGTAHVAATGESSGAGISGTDIRISGNVVIDAQGGYQGAGIGGGDWLYNASFCGSDGYSIVLNGGTVTAAGGKYAAGIGSGWEVPNGSITISNTNLTAIGGDYAAGIGGGYMSDSGTIVINSGTVTATGGRFGAGIGGGWGDNAIDITINGGTVTATSDAGGLGGAGIGGGRRLKIREDSHYFESGMHTVEPGLLIGSHGGRITIHGGTVTAVGSPYGAGIGGGGCLLDDPGVGGDGGEITIDGGQVTATAGTEAAGIGGGRYGRGGSITIDGAEVTAYAGLYGAGIGGGLSGDGADVVVNSGIVTAVARYGRNSDGGFWCSAIGAGEYSMNHGSLVLYEGARVVRGDSEASAWYSTADDRLSSCKYNSYAKIEPCTNHDYSQNEGFCTWCGHIRPPVISYVDAGDEPHIQEGYTAVDSATSRWDEGWYAVTEDITVSARIEVAGSVNLILCDGKTLNAAQGIHVPAESR